MVMTIYVLTTMIAMSQSAKLRPTPHQMMEWFIILQIGNLFIATVLICMLRERSYTLISILTTTINLLFALEQNHIYHTKK